MITDHDVIELYRCLLGRTPEDSGTIESFRTYYPNLDRGRKAIFESNEFHQYYERITGRKLNDADDRAAGLAFDFLARLGANAAPPSWTSEVDAAMRRGFRIIYRRLRQSLFAVVVGPPEVHGLGDMLPLGRAESAVLQIAPGFPPAVPLVSRLPDGTALFRLGSDAPSLAAFLETFARKIDVLILAGPPAEMTWVDALRPYFAPRALLVIGPSQGAFDGEALSVAIAGRHYSEPVQDFRGLYLHHFGDWLLPVKYDPPAIIKAPPKRADHPRLAVAAIVRNEAACIENMLRSVAPITSFFAILDTGSTDGTAERAQDCLKALKIPFAFARHTREALAHDFSAMRNTALDMVPSDMDWALMLDADEEIVPEDFEVFLKLIAETEADVFALPRYNFGGGDKSGEVKLYPDWQRRLFRLNTQPPIRYSGRVHETIQHAAVQRVPLDASALGGERGGPHIHHLVRRFRTVEEEERKQAYYKEIAQG